MVSLKRKIEKTNLSMHSVIAISMSAIPFKNYFEIVRKEFSSFRSKNVLHFKLLKIQDPGYKICIKAFS